ncbi:DUF222 domain-containing protein [Nocardioides lijunqiniae]|uniref:DUF222 domain-containing protein n=1 Tax=Nocardioides lijunqiniae TaxID=2760832 RepID=UPI001877E158|nr:DUF222 domain-containing protein [Nocardioides lijunqiniae]
MEDALAGAADVDPIYMSTDDKAAALLRLSAVDDRTEELRLRVMASAGDVAERDGARDVAAWLAHHARHDRAESRRRLRLAGGLDKHPVVARALRQGAVNVAQAEAIVRAVDELPAEVGEEVRSKADEQLVAEARTFGPHELRNLGRRVLEVVAPEASDGLEARLLEQAEARARRRTFLRTRRNGDGTTDLHLRVSDAVSDRLLTYLHAFAAPRRERESAPDDRQPHDQRMGEAFGAFLESVDPDRTPLHGGDATTVMVHIDLETLQREHGVALIGEEPISAGEARRLACTAGIVPVVLGGESQVLDLGRARRLYSPAQRKALAVRQRSCRAEGCDIPAPWCEAHHGGDPWSRGGRTDLADADLLCSFHHHVAHDHRYRVDRLPDGGVRFHRRT